VSLPGDDLPLIACAYRYRLTDDPAQWQTVICPGDDIAAARRRMQKFWGRRLIEVLPL